MINEKKTGGRDEQGRKGVKEKMEVNKMYNKKEKPITEITNY